MLLKLYYAEETTTETVANRGFQLNEIRVLMEQLEACGTRVELIDTSSLPDEELYSAYGQAIIPAVHRHYPIRKIFGSKKRSGWLFGKSVPALLVYNNENHHPTDVYPHQDGGRIITIREFLESLMKSKATRSAALQAAARMDERRTRIGPIGFKASDLIREGRSR